MKPASRGGMEIMKLPHAVGGGRAVNPCLAIRTYVTTADCHCGASIEMCHK